MKETFPKKARLVSFGGMYRIIDLERFVAKINIPIMRKVEISEPEIYEVDTWKFNLEFVFDGVEGRYAVYKQVNYVRIK